MTDLHARVDAAVIRDLAYKAASPSPLAAGASYGVLVPEGADWEFHDLEKLLDAPRAKRGIVKAHTYESLVAYADLHGSQTPHLSLWVDRLRARITAVLNGHAADEPGWGDHRAVLDLAATPEWEHWRKHDGQLLGQEAFAEHVEDGLAQIVEPSAADMLEIAQSIQATTSAQFRSARRLDSGEVAMVYDETIEAKAGRSGNLTIPSTFVLALAPYYGEQPYRITARLRYRIKGGELRIGYRIVDAHKVLDDCIASIADRLVEQFGAGRVFLGAPAEIARA